MIIHTKIGINTTYVYIGIKIIKRWLVNAQFGANNIMDTDNHKYHDNMITPDAI